MVRGKESDWWEERCMNWEMESVSLSDILSGFMPTYLGFPFSAALFTVSFCFFGVVLSQLCTASSPVKLLKSFVINSTLQ